MARGFAAVVHAGALVLAPVTIVQPLGVLAVPFAVIIAATRSRARPRWPLLLAVAVCLVAVCPTAPERARSHTLDR